MDELYQVCASFYCLRYGALFYVIPCGLAVDEAGVLQCLRAARPLYISIQLSMASWERLGIERSLKNSAHAGKDGNGALPANKRKLRVITVCFQAGPLGLKLKETKSCGGAVILTGFAKGPNDETLQAEASGVLSVGLLMLSVGQKCVFGRPFDEVLLIVLYLR